MWLKDTNHFILCYEWRYTYTGELFLLICFFVCCSSWHNSLGNREPQVKNWLNQIDLWICLWDIILTTVWFRRDQPTVVFLEYIKKLAEHNPERKLEKNIPPQFLHEALSWFCSMIDCVLKVELNWTLSSLGYFLLECSL